MGDPIRYAEVTLDSIQADAEPMTRLADGRAIQALTTQAGRTIDRFTIEVLYEYADGASLSASSYAEFLDAVVSKEGSTKSLIGKLRETATLTATRRSVFYSDLSVRVALDGGTEVDATGAAGLFTDITTQGLASDASFICTCSQGKAGTLYGFVPKNDVVSLENPTIVDIQWIPVDMTGSIYAHYALITIDII
jgi:hypothetical protein